LDGFDFNAAYYAGYGKVGKAIVLSLIGFMPLTMIGVAIYTGKNANKELPVGTVPFNWVKAIGVSIFGVIVSLAAITLIQKFKGDELSEIHELTCKNVDMLAKGNIDFEIPNRIEELTRQYMEKQPRTLEGLANSMGAIKEAVDPDKCPNASKLSKGIQRGEKATAPAAAPVAEQPAQTQQPLEQSAPNAGQVAAPAAPVNQPTNQ